MQKNDYLFAVAAIRVNELSLLKESDMEQIINAPDYKKAVQLLSEKGYELPNGNDYSSMLDSETQKTWEKIKKNAPEAEEMNCFIVKNDFQNLKAVLKSEVMDEDAKNFLVSPSVIDPEFLFEKVSDREFNDLPDFIKETAKSAFDTLTKTGNGQYCDIVIDAGALKAIVDFAKKGTEPTIIEYAENFCLQANIKTALRAVKTKKGEAFLNSAIADCDLLSKADLIEAALKGEEALLELLSDKGLSEYRQAIEKSTSAFEKYCDDKMLSIMKKAKMTAFGLSPLAAYFIARETEIKCLRIILSAKLSFVSNDVIRERMRELYV